MVRKGRRVLFVLTDGTEIEPPASYAMLHDPSGRWYSKRAVIVGPFTARGPAVNDPPADAVAYLGPSVRCGNVDLPPRALGDWKRIGVLRSEDEPGIFYERTGKLCRGNCSKRHVFNKSALDRVLLGRGRATLYSWGRWHRVELTGRTVILDDRVFGWP